MTYNADHYLEFSQRRAETECASVIRGPRGSSRVGRVSGQRLPGVRVLSQAGAANRRMEGPSRYGNSVCWNGDLNASEGASGLSIVFLLEGVQGFLWIGSGASYCP